MSRQSRILLTAALLTAFAVVFVPMVIPAAPVSQLDASGYLARGSLGIAAIVVFLGGILTSLTPCVYPLIPITVGVFGARQAKGRAAAIGLTSAYVVGMGFVFSMLGVFAALSGKVFGATLGSAPVAIGLAVFMLVLSASMFGAFEIALPTNLAARLSSLGGGGVVGAFLMGSAAGLLAAPCTGPVLTGLLAWVSSTRNVALGGGLLFIYAMGIGVPFFAIGVFTAQLPKGGVWMEWVKSIFGVALVVLAISYLRTAFPVLDDGITKATDMLGPKGALLLVGALGFGGVLIGGIHYSFKPSGRWFLKGVGVCALVGAIVFRLSSPTPLDGAANPGVQWAAVLRPDPQEGMAKFDAVLAGANAHCQAVMIDFFADWCAACKELDAFVYNRTDIAEATRGMVSVKVDGTEDDAALDKVYERFGVKGLPTIAFVDGRGNVLSDLMISGFVEPSSFLKIVKAIPQSDCALPN